MNARPFQFRLQKVLDYRVHIEDKLKAELAELKAVRDYLLAEREEARQKQSGMLDRMAESDFDVTALQLMKLYIERLDREIARKNAEIAETERRIERKRVEVVEASRDRKVMERMREAQEAEFRREQLRIEQKMLDEMGTNSFHRHAASEAGRGASA